MQFEVIDGKNLPSDTFDFITTFWLVHDSVDPPGLMASIRKALRAGGTYLVLEDNISANVEDNMNASGRFLYSISTLYCMTTSLAEGGPGIGAVMGEPMVRELSAKVGFSRFRKIDSGDPYVALYEIRV